MKNFFLASVLISMIFSSCVSGKKIEYGYPQTGTSNSASIVVKDYTTLGIIFVKSSEIFENNGSHTGSKITYEMLMKEAQKLNADDVINVRIDVVYREEYYPNGEIAKIIYDYTASALAIRYTTGAIQRSDANNSDRRSAEIALNEMQEAAAEAVKPPKNRMNFISAGANIAGGGVQYERMLNQRFSIGAEGFFQTIGIEYFNLGVDFKARFYPLKKILYVGLGLGMHGYEKESMLYGWLFDYSFPIGFAISPEIGVKLNLGKKGAFMDIGYKNPLIFNSYGFTFNTVPHIYFGYSF